MTKHSFVPERSKGADLRSAVIFTSWVQTPPNAQLVFWLLFAMTETGIKTLEMRFITSTSSDSGLVA